MDYPMPRGRKLILASLLVLAAAGWVILIWQQSAMAGRGQMPGMEEQGQTGLTLGMGAPLFLAMWVAMMVAMMFPTAAPMITVFARVSAGKQQQGQPFVPTWIFVSAYLTVWTLFGVLAYALALGAEALSRQSMWLADNTGRIGGLLLIAAGLYQLSPLKRSCLSKCRTPLNFILSSWRDGYGGAFRMGLAHGVYCLGCCWLLFVILFPLGVMNVAAMVVITLLIFAEKSLPFGRRIGRMAALVLIAYGAVAVFVPNALPTMTMM